MKVRRVEYYRDVEGRRVLVAEESLEPGDVIPRVSEVVQFRHYTYRLTVIGVLYDQFKSTAEVYLE